MIIKCTFRHRGLSFRTNQHPWNQGSRFRRKLNPLAFSGTLLHHMHAPVSADFWIPRVGRDKKIFDLSAIAVLGIDFASGPDICVKSLVCTSCRQMVPLHEDLPHLSPFYAFHRCADGSVCEQSAQIAEVES